LLAGADLVLLGGKIWTGEPEILPGEAERPVIMAEAVAILHGRIIAVGGNDDIRAYVAPATKVIDLQGRLCVPGFIDAHVHLLAGGRRLLQIDLKDTRDEAEFVRRLAEKARHTPKGGWILGGNWDEQAWPSAQLPTRWLIDSVTPDNPVLLSRCDGHAVLANSLALKLAGIDPHTPDPPGGVIVREAKTGKPTGVLKESAMELVERLVPRPTEAEAEQALQAALKEARRWGVTSIHDMVSEEDCPGGTFANGIRLLRRAQLAGQLTARIYAIVPIESWKRLADVGLSQGMGNEFLKLGAVKGFADGSLGSMTAWMFEPYLDAPETRGLPASLMELPSSVEELVRGAAEAGMQPCIHAIGDRAVAEMLDLFARVGGETGRRRRFRIEHAQHVRPQDVARFATLGVIASMQPYHAIDDGRWAEKRIGHERASTSYAWRSFIESGVPLAFGSDWPVAPLNPLLGIYAAVTRATLDGRHPSGWIPQQRLTVEQALRAFTWGSAYAAFEENEKGTIRAGKLADLAVLSDDLLALPLEKIKDVRVVLTVLGGRVVYQDM